MKKLYIIIVVVAVAALVYWWWSSKQVSVPEPSDTSDINQELNALEVNDLDNEFEEINKDLETL